MIKVALFDDHTGRRDALSLLLAIQPDMVLVGAFPNCADLPGCLEAAPPDVVLMDIDMPDVDGIQGVRLIRQHFPQTLILMQTVFEDDDKIFASIRAGAHGYLLKKASPEKLVSAIREVADGGAPMTGSIARRTLELFRDAQPATPAAEHDLSPREHQILTLLVRGFSHKMIAAELAISTFTVNNHIRKIYSKLAVHSATEAVSAAMKRGIVQ